jgi:hypothetical protein
MTRASIEAKRRAKARRFRFKQTQNIACVTTPGDDIPESKAQMSACGGQAEIFCSTVH